MRSGVIAKKLGMTRLFLENGTQVPVTVLQLDNLQVVAQRTADKDGYTAVQLGAGAAKAKRTTAAMRGHFAKASVEPKRKIAEFRVTPDCLIDVGAEITADHYLAGQFVDIAGTSSGKGFQGAMKRHNFAGLRGRINDVEKPLVRADFPLVARLLVDVRTAQNGELFDLVRQRDRTADSGAGALGSADDFRGAGIQDTVIEGFQPNANGLTLHQFFLRNVGGATGPAHRFTFVGSLVVQRGSGAAQKGCAAGPYLV